jgi:signal transduction histidine kinase
MEQHEREKIDNFILLSHDLKTNLTASKWLLGMIDNGDFGPLTTSQKEALEKVSESNERMLSSINETLFMFRSGITDQVYRFAPCDLHLIITDTLDHLQGELRKKNIVVAYTPPVEPLVVQADIEKMHIVFQNIIDNAVKYGDMESTIDIALLREQDWVTCTITNKGIGIPESEKEHIFEQYFRASNSRSHENGTGIGLFGTKQIIEKHSGKVAFESTEGGNTSFAITLPINQK